MSCYILSNKKAYTKNIDRQGNTNEFRICAPKSEPVYFIFALVQLFSRYKNYFKAGVIIDKFYILQTRHFFFSCLSSRSTFSIFPSILRFYTNYNSMH